MAFARPRFSLLLPLILLVSPLLCQSQTQPLIDRICRSTEDYGFCSKTFKDHIPGPTTDIRGFVDVAMQQTNISATSTDQFIATLLSNATDPDIKAELNLCDNGYNIVLQELQRAFDDLSKGDVRSALNAITPTPRAQASCDSYFTVPPYPKNTFADRNTEARRLIVMTIISLNILIDG